MAITVNSNLSDLLPTSRKKDFLEIFQLFKTDPAEGKRRLGALSSNDLSLFSKQKPPAGATKAEKDAMLAATTAAKKELQQRIDAAQKKQDQMSAEEARQPKNLAIQSVLYKIANLPEGAIINADEWALIASTAYRGSAYAALAVRQAEHDIR